MLPLFVLALTVYQPTHPLIRVGPNYDGGYVIANLEGVVEYDHLVSGGIGRPEQGGTVFEEQLLMLHPNISGDVYDPYVPGIAPAAGVADRLRWHNLAIGSTDDSRRTDLQTYLNRYRNLFVKMDVEGAEFNWLWAIFKRENGTAMIDNIAQLVIEWHSSHLWEPRHWEVVAKIAQTHALIHLHVCNCCPNHNLGGVLVPQVFECTYVRRDLEPTVTRNTLPIPGPLDLPNVPTNPEIHLTWVPFVN